MNKYSFGRRVYGESSDPVLLLYCKHGTYSIKAPETRSCSENSCKKKMKEGKVGNKINSVLRYSIAIIPINFYSVWVANLNVSHILSNLILTLTYN